MTRETIAKVKDIDQKIDNIKMYFKAVESEKESDRYCSDVHVWKQKVINDMASYTDEDFRKRLEELKEELKNL